MSSYHHPTSSDPSLRSALMERFHRSHNPAVEQQLHNRLIHEEEELWNSPSAAVSSLPYRSRGSAVEESYGRRHSRDIHSPTSAVSDHVSAVLGDRDESEDIEIQRMIQELDDMRAALTVRKQARDAMAAVRQRTVQMLSKKQEDARHSLRSFLTPQLPTMDPPEYSSHGHNAHGHSLPSKAVMSSMVSRGVSQVHQSRVQESNQTIEVPHNKILLAPQQQKQEDLKWRLPLPPLTPLQGAPPKHEVEYTVPMPNDVLLGRGKTTCAHEGNRQFLELVSAKKETYVSSTKKHKKVIAKALVQQVKEMGGRFLQKSPLTGMWLVVDDGLARDKTSRALRDGAPAIRKNLEQKNEAAQALFALTGTN
jgi:hypothetical protein